MSQVRFDWLPHEICRVTSHFGYRTNPITGTKDSFHQGIDIGAKKARVAGDRLFAVSRGEVVYADSMMNPEYGYGHFAIIEHDGFCTLYGHMLEPCLKIGTTVSPGKIVGLMGSSGASTAAHLHFEVQPMKWTGYKDYIARNSQGIRANAVDPYPFIEEYRLRVIKEASDEMELEELKKQIAELKVVRYRNIQEMPVHYQDVVKELVSNGVIKGNATGELNMTEDMVRVLIMAYRMDKQK